MALSTLTDTERRQRAQPVCSWCMELPIAPFELDNSPCDTLTAEPWQLAGLCSFRTGLARQATNECKRVVPGGAVLDRYASSHPQPLHRRRLAS
jgi:hypothetical protein